MQVALPELKQKVLSVTRSSKLGDKIEDVILESDRDDYGADFLRITVQVKALDRTSDSEVENLMNSIERAVSALDERFPSVRFADAA